MRKTIKRFSPPKSRSNVGRERALAIRSIDGTGHYKNSPQARAIKASAIQSQWQSQGGMCPNCHTRIPLADAKFRDREFTVGDDNPVIHKRCKTIGEES